ncbi:hypothetical protein INT44_000255 [Umbelopsis vinacea]|uniref:Defective in cullin neddylation protein n=1 Tax=Umbelopsis vinacea TaxID=44442 RepID=A0A8H7UBS5_9FUNG|nr:hypothetical protein INT44_000255 [Umbelopsis vinacea]
MPPKRKSTTKSADQPTKKSRASRPRTKKPTNGVVSQSSSLQTNNSANKRALETWFNMYKDEDEDVISPEGANRFFDDLNVSLEGIQPIVISWKLNATSMGYFTKDEWMDGMRNLNVTNNEELKAKIFDMEESLQDERQFKDFYVFVFPFAKTKTQKSMDVEMALALWEIVLKDRYAHVPLFIDFIRKQEPIKVVNKDQWTSFLDFCKVISVDLSNFDPLSSWPVLFDEYVEWRRDNGL